ncbi:MAG: phage tail tube protein, partial [Rhizorhabdus sp.]
GMIGQGETKPDGVSDAGSPAALTGPRFQQATGSVKRGGVELGSVVGADFTFSNSLEKIETIRSDGRIEGADPLRAMMTGTLTLKFASLALYNLAVDGTPIDLSFGWTNGTASLVFTVARVFLPRTKRPIQGPSGIQQQLNWQASGAGGHVLTAVLTNDVAGY